MLLVDSCYLEYHQSISSITNVSSPHQLPIKWLSSKISNILSSITLILLAGNEYVRKWLMSKIDYVYTNRPMYFSRCIRWKSIIKMYLHSWKCKITDDYTLKVNGYKSLDTFRGWILICPPGFARIVRTGTENICVHELQQVQRWELKKKENKKVRKKWKKTRSRPRKRPRKERKFILFFLLVERVFFPFSLFLDRFLGRQRVSCFFTFCFLL